MSDTENLLRELVVAQTARAENAERALAEALAMVATLRADAELLRTRRRNDAQRKREAIHGNSTEIPENIHGDSAEVPRSGSPTPQVSSSSPTPLLTTSFPPPLQTLRRDGDKPTGYPPEFELTWQAYPKRLGGNSKREAFKAWTARRRDGVDYDVLHAGTLRYAAYCLAVGKIGTEYVKQAAVFFGPNQHYAEAWELPSEPAKVVGSIPNAEAEHVWTLCKRYGFHHCTRSTIDGELERAKDAGDIDDPEAFKTTLRKLDVSFLREARSDGAAIASIAKRLAA